MNFYEKRRPLPIIPIIPMIDILCILLLFFIASTTFKQKRTLLNISLPKASQMSGQAALETRTTISVTNKEEIYINEQPVTLEQLPAALLFLKSQNPGLKLELRADEDLPLGMLVGVWDAFNQAGIPIKDVPARIQLQKAGTP